MSALHLLAASALLALVHGCAVPHGGCRLEVCRQYSGVSVETVDYPDANYDDPATWSQGSLPLIGYWFGKYNKLVNGGSYNRAGIKDTPALNYERFDLQKSIIDPKTGQPYATPSTETSIAACCETCAKTDGCYLFQFFPPDTPAEYNDGVACWLLSGGTSTWDWAERGTPYAGSFRRQTNGARLTIPPSFAGGRCNGSTGVYDDPHFTGAHGTRFDFNGDIDKSFCLVSDQRLHINTLLKGYREARTDGATVGADGKALRTWIRELGILWKDDNGASHTLLLVARNGKQQERGNGFIAKAEVDGRHLNIPGAVGSVSRSAEGDLAFTFRGTRKQENGIEVDHYNIKIGTLLDLSLSARVAHPKMQAPDEAQAHFNLLIDDLQRTDKIHGVLGQTFRNSEKQVAKAVKYTQLVELLGGPVQADGKTGEGFLEGKVEDYETSSITGADCKFSAFL